MESPLQEKGPQALHKTFSSYGPGKVNFHDEDSESVDSSSQSSYRALVKPFVIKQWLHKGVLYREKRERVPSRFELFFDLVFVGIAHTLSETAAEHAGGVGLAQFILTFFPTWSLWSEFRAFVNASGTDDILQRIGILYMMALLIGYTANASAISIAFPAETHSVTTSETTTGHGEVIARALYAAVSESDGRPTSKRDAALVTATVFYLLGRAIRIGFLWMYAHALPRFRVALLVQSVHQVICFFIYFPLIFVRSTTAIVTLASLGIAFDLLARYTVGIATVVTKRREKKRQIDEEVNGTTCKEEEESPSDSDSDGDKVIKEEAQCQFDKHRGDTMSTSMPALNIEHFLERTAAFVVIVLGEMVLSIMYHATGSQIGFKRIYGNAICGLMIAFNLCWLYFDAECSRKFLHAIRRHWFSGLTFTTLHFPLCASLILVSAAMSQMTQHSDDVSSALRWYFGGGLGCAMLCLAALGLTHRGLDPSGMTRLSRSIQLGFRLIAGVVMTCLPLAKHLKSLHLMGICAGVTSFLVIEETYGKICRGEPIAKLSAREQDALDQQNEAADTTAASAGVKEKNE